MNPSSKLILNCILVAPSLTPTNRIFQGTYGKTQPVSGTRGYTGVGGSSYGGTGPSGGTADKRRPGNSSLQELDNLLEDLSNSRYANMPAGKDVFLVKP